MKQWEYKVAFIAHRGGENIVSNKSDSNYGRYLWELDIEKTLNELGAYGWELHSFPMEVFDKALCGYAVFKRQKG